MTSGMRTIRREPERRRSERAAMSRAHPRAPRWSSTQGAAARGQTALLQRLYNITFDKNDGVIPFYYEVKEGKQWAVEFCQDFFLRNADQVTDDLLFRLQRHDHQGGTGLLMKVKHFLAYCTAFRFIKPILNPSK